MRGTLAGAFSACLGLIVLHAVASSGGSGRIREAFRDVNTLLEHVLDPTVPAIPDLRAGQSAAAAAAAQGTTSPNYDLISGLKPGDFAPRPTSNATPTTGSAKYNLGGYSAPKVQTAS